METEQWYRANHEACRISLDVFEEPDVDMEFYTQKTRFSRTSPTAVFSELVLPPSISAAAGNAKHIQWQQQAYGEVAATSFSEEEFDFPAVIAPNSFLHRSLLSGPPRVMSREQEFPRQSPSEETLLPRVDSAVEMLDHASGSRDTCISDQSGGEPFNNRMITDDAYDYSLRYHLLQTNSRDSGIVLEDIMGERNDEAPPQLSTGHDQALQCDYCANGKIFTGLWAPRNLARHMEQKHSSCDSAHFRCSFTRCPRTFRRTDARLVHERRSHPELNRPPPVKRKTSDEA